MTKYTALEKAIENRKQRLSLLQKKQANILFRIFAPKAKRLILIDEIFSLETEIEAKENYLKTLNTIEK